MSFVHLHTHSEFSLLDGAQRIGDIVSRARQWGMPAVALTDHGNLFGAVQFYEKATDAGIAPILGAEIYVAPGSRTDKTREPGAREPYEHMVLLARDQQGYKNLMALVSRAYLEGFYYRPRVDDELLAEYAGGLIALSGCLSGRVASNVIKGNMQAATDAAMRYSEIFGPGNFYLEIQDHGMELERTAARGAIEIAAKTGLPLVATNDSHYLERAHAEAHDVLICIQTGKMVSDTDRLRFDGTEVYFKSPEEMHALFAERPDAIANTLAIAERCAVKLPLGQMLLPAFPIPDGYTDAASYLADLARAGLAERYGRVTPELETRLAYELDTITQMGFPGYFLIVRDFCQRAREMGVAVGPGRGSAAGSLVSYVLGITDLDPIRFGLIFERFLNPERVTMPDIDIDFDDRGRDRVIKYVVEKYGAESVTQIITFGTMAARAAVRDVARTLGLPFAETDRVAKLVPPELGMTLQKALDQVPELRQLGQQGDTYRTLLSVAQTLEGLARHASTHAAGVVIAPGKLVDYVPLYRSVKGEVTTQFDMKSIEKIGLLKMDFLGLRTLTVIEDALALLRERGDTPPDLSQIPLDDPMTFDLLRRAETVGVFQLESSGMRDLVRRLEPDSFDDIVAVNALFRPGPLQSGMVDDFIDVKHGRKKPTYEHKSLEPILRETYGVILYQEQVMAVANTLAGFTLGQADNLRRAMGKKKPEEMAKMESLFLAGCAERSIPHAKAKKIFDLMAHFAGYGFNKSHSAAYAMLTYRTAYLKAHHPPEFFAAVMTSELGDTDRIGHLVEEARRSGIPVLGPDINSSREGFRVEGGAILFGLAAVKTVGEGAVRHMCEVRATGGPYQTLHDFCTRVDTRTVNKRVVEHLVCAGAFDTTGAARSALLARLDDAFDAAQRLQRAKAMMQESLFGAESGVTPPPPRYDGPEWPASEKLAREKQALGFYLSDHPLSAYREAIRRVSARDTALLAELPDGVEGSVVGLVAALRPLTDRAGRPMVFVTLEDFAGSIEVLVFADVYAQVRALLVQGTVVFARGRVSARENERPKIVAVEIRPFTAAEDAPPGDAAPPAANGAHVPEPELRIALTCLADGTAVEEVLAVCARHPGDHAVVLTDIPGAPGRVVRARGVRVAATNALLDELARLLGEGQAYARA